MTVAGRRFALWTTVLLVNLPAIAMLLVVAELLEVGMRAAGSEEGKPAPPDPFAHGPEKVAVVHLVADEEAGRLALRIVRPTSSAPRAVLQLQHGFQGRTEHLAEFSTHLATHGVLVVAPQMVEPGPRALVALPDVATEGEAATRLARWIATGGLHRRLEIEGPVPPLYVAGHSRGGGVAWHVGASDVPVRGVVGLDPVATSWKKALPRPKARTFVLGAGVEGPCAPRGRRHEQFAAGLGERDAWLVMDDLGHGDLLDDRPAKWAGYLCGSGRDPATARRATAGLLLAFLDDRLEDVLEASPSAVRKGAVPPR